MRLSTATIEGLVASVRSEGDNMSKRIASFADYSIAGLVVTQLRDIGLSPLAIETASHVTVAGADPCYYIEVDESETDKARNALIELGHEKWLIKI